MALPRISAARKQVAAASVDALLVSNPINSRYLSGFDGTSGLLLLSSEKAFLVTDSRYLEQAEQQAPDFVVLRRDDDLYAGLAGLIQNEGWRSLGFEARHLSYAKCQDLAELLPVKTVALSGSIEQLRMIKDCRELAIMRRGAKILDRAFDYLLTLIKPGMREADLALELEIFLLRQGAEQRSFRFIVASGVRGAMPHGSASEKVMEKGDLVTIDFGACFEGYATDITRTICLGKPGQLQREIYDLVFQAQAEAAAALRPGKTTKEIDAIARDIIEQAGYGEYFSHGLGHGIGLEVHEDPTLSQRSETMLQPGMVVSIEPGVYLPGRGGVRIEDMTAITETGAEIMTASRRGLILIE